MNDTTATGGTPPTPLLMRIVRLPLIRILFFLGGIVAAIGLVQLLTASLVRGVGPSWASTLATVAPLILAVHFTYRGMVRLVEWRSAAELSLSGAARETAAGVLVGAGCLTVTVALVAALGYYQVDGIGAWAALVTALGIAAMSSYIEEVIFQRRHLPDRGRRTRHLAGARDHGGALRTRAPEQSQRDALRCRGNRGRSRDAARSRLCLDPAALARDRGPFWMEFHAGGCLRAESLGR